MPVRLSQAEFCSLVAESGLISSERLARLREQFLQQHTGHNDDSCLALTEYLVRENELTLWQAKKLLQGKHKGFIVGKYKLLSLLGRGGMSSVYLAEHIVMRRKCAIKILPFKHVQNAAALNRFYREAQAVAALDDRNIVRAYDVDKLVERGTEIHFLVMEYVDGRSLQQVVDEDGPLPITEAVEYTRQAASGLAHAHRVGVIHRDVKPSNLLLDETGTIKLLDLGLARIFEDASEQSSLTIEHQQTVLGTADYLSPEQAVDSHGVDHRSDIYSLGCTLYFLLTGYPPFPEGTLTQRLLAHQNKIPAPVTASRPEVPASLVELLERMMAKKLEARYQSADDLVTALAQWLEKQGSSIADSSAGTNKPNRPRKTRTPSGRSNTDRNRPKPVAARPSPPDTPRQSGPKSSHVMSVRDEDSDVDLSSFLRHLESAGRHDTVTPSIPTSETVVATVDLDLIRSQVPESSSAPAADSDEPKPEQPGSTETAASPPPIDIDVTFSRSGSGSYRRRRFNGGKHGRALTAILGGGLLCGALIAGYFVWTNGRQSAAPSSAIPGNVGAGGAATVAEFRPEIGADEDLRVGPEGHFASIEAALDHVRESFHPLSPSDTVTIRVTGGRTYEERIALNNSQSRTFPQGVRMICEDPEPAVLQPSGDEPIIDLRTIERFQLKGFTIRGTGQAVLVRLEGYLVGTVLETLSMEGATEVGLRGVGATGLGSNRLILQDLTFRDPASEAVAMEFTAGLRPTRNLLIRRCRVLNGFATGVHISGGVSRVELSQCIFDSAKTSVRLDASEGSLDPWDGLVIANCTFRGFDRGIHFARPPGPSDSDLRFTKNLFADASGPECLITGVSNSAAAFPVTASFNWTQCPAPANPQPGEVDLFDQQGRRGVGLTFVSIDPDQPTTYLQPESAELREVAAALPQNPKFIGAVAPAPE